MVPPAAAAKVIIKLLCLLLSLDIGDATVVDWKKCSKLCILAILLWPQSNFAGFVRPRFAGPAGSPVYAGSSGSEMPSLWRPRVQQAAAIFVLRKRFESSVVFCELTDCYLEFH